MPKRDRAGEEARKSDSMHGSIVIAGVHEDNEIVQASIERQ